MLEIFIKGNKESGFLDLEPDTILEMESLQDLFDEDLSTGEFSLPVEIPLTERNKRLLDFAERIENFTALTHYWSCDVMDHGFPELVNAKITLLEKSANLAYTRGRFSASISGNKGLFGSNIKGKKLADLLLDGLITWDDDESRKFATDHMKGLYPQFPHISFAPVVIENFFDEGRNYFGEFLAEDTVNNIVITGAGVDDWEFGRPKSTDPSEPTAPGDAEHIDARTIPFFKFKYILQKAFLELGYTLDAEILANSDLDDLHIFNSTAIDYYSTVSNLDYNRKINPIDHLPDMLLIDFFKAIFSFFNLYPIFTGTSQVTLQSRKKIFTERKVLDITKRCDPNFTGPFTDINDETGYVLQYEWDAADDYYNDRIKDLSTKNKVATVYAVGDLGALNIGRDFTTDDIAYVEVENMWYQVANAVTVPVLWDAYSEGLDEYKVDQGSRIINVGLSTLCTYVEFDEDDAVYIRKNKVACRQTGSYWNNKLIKCSNPFGLRLFYIKKQLISGNLIPVSYNHNTSTAGTSVAKYSLALDTINGVVNSFHKEWQAFLQKNQMLKFNVQADAQLMQDLKDNNTIQIQNILFLARRIEKQIPLQNTILIELIPL